jgi:hypothetical protein
VVESRGAGDDELRRIFQDVGGSVIIELDYRGARRRLSFVRRRERVLAQSQGQSLTPASLLLSVLA